MSLQASAKINMEFISENFKEQFLHVTSNHDM